MTGMNPVLCIGARKYRNRLGTVIRLVVVGEKRERERGTGDNRFFRFKSGTKGRLTKRFFNRVSPVN